MIHTARSINEANLLAQAIVNTIREPLLVLDADLRVLAASRYFYETFRVEPAQTEGSLLYALGEVNGIYRHCVFCWRRSSLIEPTWMASRSSMIFRRSAIGSCC